MFLTCSYFLAKFEADVLINSVLIKRKACTACTGYKQAQSKSDTLTPSSEIRYEHKTLNYRDQVKRNQVLRPFFFGVTLYHLLQEA